MSRSAIPAVSHDRRPLIVHSHLRWDFVWQRPQQLLSRFARTRPVLFVEEPVFLDDLARPRLDVTVPSPGVHRVVPCLPSSLREGGSYDSEILIVRALVQRLVGEGGALDGMFDDSIQWFYTPMPARAMIGAFGEVGVVYDCMDELAQFRFAPPDLTQRERFLLSRADVVFTGGRRLYESKSRYHERVYFFGCGVDADHFAQARHPKTPEPAELRGLPRPILGYFGVVDERLDYQLIQRLAESFNHGSVVFVGPLAKVERRELPQNPNLHWLGQRAYTDLPAYVKGFDVCLMPFALNEATEFINPTKTLEYMAAGRPIVSTRIPDVARNFTPIVQVADSVEEFVAAAAAAAKAPDVALLERGIARARSSSWNAIVEEMGRLMADALAVRRRDARRSALAAAGTGGRTQRDSGAGGATASDEGIAGVA